VKSKLIFLGLASMVGAASVSAAELEVTVTNVTRGTIFTPILVVSHSSGLELLEPGQPASDELAALAEGGDTVPLADKLGADSRFVDSATSGGLLLPGESVTVKVEAPKHRSRVSLGSMMLPTNDGFIALNGVLTPAMNRTVTYHAPGYDAGSEPNDELCASIPGGGDCGGEGGSPGVGGEGHVHVHSGIHGSGDLSPAAYDWKNPVVHISIKKVK